MSTYGVVFNLDAPTDAQIEGNELQFATMQGSAACPTPGLRRISGFGLDIEALEPELEQVASSIRDARLALAEDFDEYGARFRVLHTEESGQLVTVYDAYVLNADTEDPEEVREALNELGEDPRVTEITGPDAAIRAAALFSADPSKAVRADELWRGHAWEGIGEVGGPFPWWTAMGLTWPS